MKRFYYILALVGALFISGTLQAQEEQGGANTQQRRSPRATRGEREVKKDSNLPELTVRAQDMNERMTQEIGNAPWMRVIYRQIDLTKEQNAPLYYPVRPMNGQMNLFSIIFQLLSENKIKAYEYLDGYEQFDEAHQVNFKELLDRFYILYEEVPAKNGDEPMFVINESDVPSEDVRSYYIKEAWYFDQNNSVFDVKTLAICPILTSNGDMGETTMPMFWLPYENIRPYINTAYIMTSNINNAMTFTMDDYFRRRMFDGEIIKTQNLMNRPLQAYCPTPDSLKREQDRIEGQLVAFEKSLWLQPDTAQVVDAKADKKARKASVRGNSGASAEKAPAASKEKTVKTKAPKAERSAPVKSVRRRR
ncbi:type IX secretion system ring subunit PorN/GldN [Parabacteroides chinchillae]